MCTCCNCEKASPAVAESNAFPRAACVLVRKVKNM
jgi:hypothetical protein